MEGEMCMEGDRVGGDRQQQQRSSAAFPTARRAGSSWNRGSSGWSVGGKDPQRLKKKAGMTDFSGLSFGDDFDESQDSAARKRSDADSQTTSKTDDPQVELDCQKEGGVFRVSGSVETVVDPDTLYGIITDYNSNARVFRNVDRVEVEQKGDDKVVTQYLHWNFLMWSGDYDIKMRMKDDPQNRSISYELEQPGFLKIFNGSWTVEPLSSETSKLVVDQRALPSFFPPGPLAVGAGTYAQKIMSSQVRNLLTDLATEASEVKKNNTPPSTP
ncbi:unnamed protein product [Calypogeia fissa]